MVSPAAIRFTDSSKVAHMARNWPAFFAALRISMVLSISALVMLPLSPYLMSPRASMAMAASMMPMPGTDTMDVLPFHSGLSNSDQLSILRLTRSEEHTSELQSPDHLVCR